ncbi:DNA gyrase [Lentimicrobium saccharophilum]|uniref:DNA gyrase n=1 Tax=Lentimicrobium saccharophilum TaxID=1678841 RepID=A0A0S7BV14_9BACT|nr:DNA gyrase/topoisomerase IV subunit A [Lentimicrobium saccharophilum]GAP44773.1 DNA gyrase [Lentimicrobium saccharophilum]
MEENSLNNGSEEFQPEEIPEVQSGADPAEMHKTVHLSGMYENWFLDYASYVILERAVPEIIDGLKPVQRRLLHAMDELDDGRYNKVANIIGHTMKYHPHGDASIGDALVQLGQKDLLIDTQGNWGNIHTGDSAAAPRYIEARLSKFALEVVFNPKTTKWKLSYDGRNKEPVTLPVKFPLLLAQGVEGIAVGLASKILPHNFIELIDSSIKILQGKDFELLPDFPTGGLADCSRYNDGLRGGKVRLRAKVSQYDKKTLIISELPFGVTTESLIDSIINANEKGKIKIRKIDDNTAQNVEILIHLVPGISPDTTIDALYAFTDCEISISPNNCVISDGKPRFLGVKQILIESTEKTVELLKMELEIRRQELLESLLYASLERIFIENRIYRDIEECTSWDDVIKTIDKGLEPYKPQFYREITIDDILRLTEIKIKRISKFNAFKADELINNLNDEKAQVEHYLANLTEYAIEYFKNIRRKFGKGRERRTELRSFDNIEAVMVAAATQKLYVNRAEGFAGTGLKKDEYVCDCSDIDDIIAFREDGTFIVTKVAEKVFVGEHIIHIDVFRKNDERTIYNLIYQDGKNGAAYVKRFAVVGITRDKEYSLTKGTAGSKVLYFTANPNGEAELVKVNLKPRPKLKKPVFDFDFSELAIKGRNSQGNILTKYAVKKISQAEAGISTLGARDIWFDDSIRRLNTEGRGRLMGAFSGDDKILAITQSGHYRLFNFDLANHFDEDLLIIEKFNPEKPVSVVYFNGEKQFYYLKRFLVEPSDKKTDFLGEEPETKLVSVSTDWLPRFNIVFDDKLNNKVIDNMEIEAAGFIDVKSYRAKGKRLTTHAVKKINQLDPLPYIPAEEMASTVPPVTDEGQETRDIELPPRERKAPPDEDAIQMTIDF